MRFLQQKKLLDDVVSNQVRGSETASPHHPGAIAKVIMEFVTAKDSSKIIDKNGEPLVVYHGSGESEFNTFDNRSDIGYHFGRHFGRKKISNSLIL